MKQILLICFLAVASFSFVEAQTAFRQTAFKPTGAYSNAAVDTMTAQFTNSYSIIAIQPVVTRLTGTMAGTAVLYYSVNGTNWVASGDTLTLANAVTNTTIWNKSSAAKYWRILVGGGTTVTATAAAKFSVK